MKGFLELLCLLFFLPAPSSAQTARPRIAISSISHESNSFNPATTGLKDFTRRSRTPAREALLAWGKSSDTISGFVEGGERFSLELYPGLVAEATPKGPVTDEAFNTLTRELIDQLRAAPKLDGLLLHLHGAMVTESVPHGDAEVLRRLRAAFGTTFPIIVTHDFHANVSPEIVELSTALITYKENPHIDTRERGIQAAGIMAGIVSGKVKPAQALAKPAMIYNIVYQYTKRDPLRPIVEESRLLEKNNPKILAVSVSGGYQYADVPFVGPTVIVVTDNDRALAQKEADRLSNMLWATRDKLTLNLPDSAAAVKQAMASKEMPVVLVEMGDNIGGGSAGDSTFILAELLRQKAQGWCVVVADPAAVQAAARTGVGQPISLMAGGKTDRLHGEPVKIVGKVRSIHAGTFLETEVRHGGQRYYDQGLTAVIEVEGSTPDLANLLMVTSERQVPFSLHQLISCGIYPERQRILVVKAAIAFRAAYEPIARRIIEVDTPGTTAVNPARFTYRRARRPLLGLNP